MATFTKEQLDAIRAKAEDQRTEDEKQALLNADKDNFPKSWEEVFQHSRFKDLNRRMKDAEETATRLQKEKDDAEAASLEKQGEFKALYEAERQKRLTAEGKVAHVETLEKVLQDALDAELKALPEATRKLVPVELSVQQQLSYISRNRALLTKEFPPKDLGSGKRGSGKQESVDLTTDEVAIAKRFGMKPEEYAKYRDEDLEDVSVNEGDQV